MEFKTLGLSRAVIDTVLKLAFIGALLIYTYDILSPFINLIIWALIITISLVPLHAKVTDWLGGRKKIASLLIIAVLLAIVIVPFGFLTNALINNVIELKGDLNPQAFTNIEPDESVKQWPVVGEKIYELWHELATNQTGFVQHHKDNLLAIGEFIVNAIGNLGKSVLLFFGAAVIAGFLLIFTSERQSLGVQIGTRLAGKEGAGFATLVEKTIRSVVTGVLGVAIIQAVLAGIGFFVMGVPFAAIWTVLALFLAMIQIGVGPIAIAAIAYGFMYYNTTPAVFFLIWNVLVMLSDNAIKPILLGRGLDVPMLVIFVGALGGMISNGILGLFLGPVILALAYKLFKSWLTEGKDSDSVKMKKGPLLAGKP